MTHFCIEGLNISLSGKTILDDINTTINKSEITAIVGPNGAGKTTFLKALYRIHKPYKGKVLYRDRNVHDYCGKEIAKTISVVPQIREVPDGLTVENLISYGRFPHRKRFTKKSISDFRAVERAMEITHTMHLASRYVSTLSGGEQQRTWLAMALAQEPDVMILDEPTTFLDIAYQLEILEVLKHLNREKGLTIIMVIHDLNHALRYADNILLFNKGRLVKGGRSEDVLTKKSLYNEFYIDCDIYKDSRNNCNFFVPHKEINHKGAS